MTRLRPEIIESFHHKQFATPVIGVTGGKGGVEKTTVAVNLAVSMADMGLRVAHHLPRQSVPFSLKNCEWCWQTLMLMHLTFILSWGQCLNQVKISVPVPLAVQLMLLKFNRLSTAGSIWFHGAMPC